MQYEVTYYDAERELRTRVIEADGLERDGNKYTLVSGRQVVAVFVNPVSIVPVEAPKSSGGVAAVGGPMPFQPEDFREIG